MQDDDLEGNANSSQEQKGVSCEIDERLLALYPQQNQPQAQQSPRLRVHSKQITNSSHILLTRIERSLIENSWKKSRKVKYPLLA